MQMNSVDKEIVFLYTLGYLKPAKTAVSPRSLQPGTLRRERRLRGPTDRNSILMTHNLSGIWSTAIAIAGEKLFSYRDVIAVMVKARGSKRGNVHAILYEHSLGAMKMIGS